MRREFAQGTAKTVHEISDIKRVDRARERAWAKKTDKNGKTMVGIMSTGFLALALAIGLSAGTNISNASAKYVLTEPPRYYANQETDFMITRIVPSDGTIEATEMLMDGHDYHNIYHINVAFGSDPSDYALSQLRYSNNPGDTTVFNNYAVYGGAWMDGQSEDISQDFKRNGGNLVSNITGRMYFVAVYSDFKTDFGRVDYSRCINSSVFISGEATECRMERAGNGKIQYQPYNASGERVEIPAEEDVELTALTDRFIYESGDWPAEYEWVEDEPEGDDSDNVSNVESNDSDGDGDTKADELAGVDVNDNVGSTTGVGDSVVSASSADTSGAIVATEAALVSSSGATVARTSNASNVDPVTIEIQVVDSGGNSASVDNGDSSSVDSGITENEEVISTEGEQDDVGVPELGKEFWSQKWVAVPLALLAAAVALTGWWFLFFGKKKSNKERKEEK